MSFEKFSSIGLGYIKTPTYANLAHGEEMYSGLNLMFLVGCGISSVALLLAGAALVIASISAILPISLWTAGVAAVCAGVSYLAHIALCFFYVERAPEPAPAKLPDETQKETEVVLDNDSDQPRLSEASAENEEEMAPHSTAQEFTIEDPEKLITSTHDTTVMSPAGSDVVVVTPVPPKTFTSSVASTSNNEMFL